MPGVGLLVMRLGAGAGLVQQVIVGLRARPPIGMATLDMLLAIAAMLLAAGLWTPIAGALVAIIQLWTAIFSHPPDPWTFILLGTLGVALALLGPGAWSVDARLFGWKRIDIGNREG
jgi:putative oxidoreductase